MHGASGDEAGTEDGGGRAHAGRHRAPVPPVPAGTPAVAPPAPAGTAAAPARVSSTGASPAGPLRPTRWLAWMLAGFVVVGGGLVAGYAALGDTAGASGVGAAPGVGGVETSSSAGPGVSPDDPAPRLPAPVVPPCDGSYVLVVGSVTTPVGYQEAVVRLLEATPGARWFTTEGTCGSLRERSEGGTLIHTVYLGPFPTAEAALASCAAGPADAYAKRLDDGAAAAGGVVTCG